MRRTVRTEKEIFLTSRTKREDYIPTVTSLKQLDESQYADLRKALLCIMLEHNFSVSEAAEMIGIETSLALECVLGRFEPIRNKDSLLLNICSGVKFFADLYPWDCTMAVSDKEKILYYYPGEKIDLGIKAGDALKDDEPLKKTILLRKKVNELADKSLYGIEFRAFCTPIKSKNGRVIGALGLGIPLNEYD